MTNYININIDELNKDVLLEFEENEKRIKYLLKIPKKRISIEEENELRYRVHNRVNIIHRMKK